MPKYLVKLSAEYHNSIEVEADTREEAEELACEQVENEVLKCLSIEEIEKIKEDKTEFFIGERVYPTDVEELHCLAKYIDNGSIKILDFYGVITEKDKEDNTYVVTWINGRTKEEFYSDIKKAWWDADGLTIDFSIFFEEICKELYKD